MSRFLHLKVQLEQNANPDNVALESDPFFTYSDDRSDNRSNDRRNDQPIEPLPYDSYSAAVGKTFYRIDEDRIFKSGDLRYFDHPRMGVLAKIERVVEPEPEEEPEAIVAPASSL